MYKIEKGVPMPAARAAYTRYTFADMDVGDSFSVPTESVRSAAKAARSYGRRNNCKFVCRTDGDGGRVWRIE